MEGRTSGHPEVHYDAHRRLFVWRCHVETLSGACCWKCQGSGEAHSYTAAINAVYAHVAITHRENRMDFRIYQETTRVFAIYPGAGLGDNTAAITYLALGAVGEAGEIANKAKKILRDGADHRAAILAEIGDVLWYLARLADELGADLGDVALSNIEKLLDRQARGVLAGSGDAR